MDHDLLIKALHAAQKGQKYAFATVVESTKKGTPQKAGAKMLVLDDGTIYGTIGGGRNEKAAQKECLESISRQKSRYVTYNYFGREGESVCGGQIKVFIEPYSVKEEFIICGAGHIALPLSVLGKMLNFHVTIIDNRRSYANAKRFPHVDKIICGNHAKSLRKIKITDKTYIMIVTQGNEFDFECLKEVIKADAAYIGVISSKAKKIKFFNRLKKADITQKHLNKIHIPSGLDIGAQTPEEIAVSIASEITAIRNQTLIGTDKFKVKN
ncbi:MAG: XdhC family protein [Candidatus Omnitrophica bacterium]|nr:XdhC family protein [Candidatus Omnitrophota bacterium]